MELLRALELGPAPDFDGHRCVDCGNRFRPQGDHIEPLNGGQNPTCLDNLDDRCYECHREKTRRDRAAGKLGPRARADAEAERDRTAGKLGPRSKRQGERPAGSTPRVDPKTKTERAREAATPRAKRAPPDR